MFQTAAASESAASLQQKLLISITKLWMLIVRFAHLSRLQKQLAPDSAAAMATTWQTNQQLQLSPRKPLPPPQAALEPVLAPQRHSQTRTKAF